MAGSPSPEDVATWQRPRPANRHLRQAEPFLPEQAGEPWEKACAMAVEASVAAADDSEILDATLRVVPKPESR